jgi:sulfane dehydrogenase subunit SoxC
MQSQLMGKVRKAPENFVRAHDVGTVFAEARAGRRDFIRGAFAAAAASAAAVHAQDRQAVSGDGDPNILELPAHSKGLGQPVVTDGYGKPSRYEANVQRRQSPGLTQTKQASVSFAPLQSLFGIVTPSGLHFERHHQGWWDIDPSHRLMINGLVKKPKVFTMDEIMRLPSVSRFHFIECGANTGMEWGNVAVPTVQYARHAVVQRVHRRAAAPCSRLRRRLQEGPLRAGRGRRRLVDDPHDPMELSVRRGAGRLRPERRDAAPRKRLPAAPGGAGRAGRQLGQVAAPHRSGRQPYATKDEAVHYIDLMPDGLHRQYTSIQECKSVITTPSGGQMLLDKGFYNISGLAWSGRGKVKRVDVSFDGGVNWRPARLEGPVQNKALTRFNIDWVWDGKPAILQSRAMDETGYVQPSYGQLRKVRGTKSIYHNNAIQSWKVVESGEVSNVQVL